MITTSSSHQQAPGNYSVRLYFSGQNREPEQILRQTPGGRGLWKGVQFHINEGPEPADFIVVFGSGHNTIRENISPENSLFIGSEPPAIKTYPETYLAQFNAVICSDPDTIHPDSEHTQQGYPWFCGLGGPNIKKYDDYQSEISIGKTKAISVVCSNKNQKPGHKKRFEFVTRLKAALGDELELFGNGQRFVPDKADAIRPYQYHIVIENSISPHYWSEKLADSYLEGAFPFYSGCPNIDQYFSPAAYRLIDIDDIDSTLLTIREAIKSDLFRRSRQALEKAKLQVLNDYNLFNVIYHHIRQRGFPQNEPNKNCKAYPGKYYRRGPIYRLNYQIRNLYAPKTHS